MSDTEHRNSLTERLGTQRLSAPGVLSRDALERRHDELTRGATPNVLVERLHRRSEFSSNTAGSFVWSQAPGSQSSSDGPWPIVSATPVQGPMATRSVVQRKELPSESPSPAQTRDLPHALRGEVKTTSTASTPAPSPHTVRERGGERGHA